MKERVAKIKEECDLDASLKQAAAIKKANEMMGLPGTGTLPDQVAALFEALDLEED